MRRCGPSLSTGSRRPKRPLGSVTHRAASGSSSISSAPSPNATSSSRRPDKVGHPASRSGCGIWSCLCGSRTCPSTTSAARSPATARRSARQPSPRSWPRRASPSCRDGGTRSDPITLVPRWPMPLTSANSTCRRGTSAPSSVACSCSCLIWSRPTWTRSWLGVASPARR
jgi:hypothetical protein